MNFNSVRMTARKFSTLSIDLLQGARRSPPNQTKIIQTSNPFSTSTSRKMRFVQFEQSGSDKVTVGVLSEDGSTVHDLSSVTGGSNMVEFIGKGIALDTIKSALSGCPKLKANDVKLVSPITKPEKIVCVGLNYRGHCEEQNKAPPKEPMFFSKYASAITGPTGDVVAHSISDQLDWEVELAVVIGKTAKHVKRADAWDYVYGYTVAQDISARDWQKTRNGGQFLIGKSMDTFCPLGPALVHKSLVADPQQLEIKCKVNGVLKQSGNTNELVFRIDDIIERLTQSITLRPGDVILTGTPAGVGMHRNPPEFLKPGDVIESEIQGLGAITNKVITG